MARVPVNPSIANRLRIGFALTFALLVAVAIIAVGRLFGLRQDYEDATARSFTLQVAVERQQRAFVAQGAALASAQADPFAARAAFAEARAAGQRATGTARGLSEGLDPAEFLVARSASAEERWTRLIARPTLGGDVPSQALQARLTAAVTNPAEELVAVETQRRVDLDDEVTNDSRNTLLFGAAIVIFGLLAAVLLFRGLVGSMRRPLEQLVGAAGKLAGGDLRARVSVGGPAETAKLGGAFNEMADELQDAYRNVEESRQRLAVTMESLSDGIVTVDERGTVTDANPAAKQMLPWAEVGTPIRELLVGPLPAGRVERLLAGREQEELQLGEGEEILALTASKLGAEEGGTVLSIRNVSERARVERMKDEFVLTASHELRSPLTSVQGFAELMLLEREKLDESQTETVEIILDNSRHLVRLLNDLLDLARSDVGRLTITPVPTEAAGLIEDAVRTLGGRADAKSQRIVCEIDPELPPIRVEPDRIRQVLINLLTNAVEYCEEGATVRVSAARVGEEVELAVSDDGPGIAAKELEHIFDRFTRGDVGNTQRVGGTGLGLAISKSLVEAHGGAINVTSTVGRGSTFRVVLPAIIDAEAPTSAKLLERKP